MKAEALSCPHCGAPLSIESGQTLALCIYCHTSIRINWGEAAQSKIAPQLTTENTLSEAIAKEIQDLVAAGKLAEAARRYHAESGVTEAEAEQAIGAIGRKIALQYQDTSPLNGIGYGIVGIGVGLVLCCGATIPVSCLLFLMALSTSDPGQQVFLSCLYAIFAGLAVTSGAGLLFWFRGNIRATLKYMRAKTAPARVIKSVWVGMLGENYAFRVFTQVEPAGEAPFQAEFSVISAPAHLERLHTGTVIQVKYLPDEPAATVMDKLLSY